MKGRSHRLPTSDPSDDWVDGSWTVDCVCGVNFDDGEEMVNCDECGVWVHTRCSRYVKGEASFACDKCKSKSSRNDSEETEVAQLLVELPTKTMRMENPYPLNNPPRHAFRLWTDIPIEDRVHVQGIPGGEPGLFAGLSSVFTPELWKCSGYVPKKFNFQYREFPCWEEKTEVDGRIEEDNESPVEKSAGVLFSLSKETVFATPVATLVGMRGQAGESGCGKKTSLKETKKCDGEDLDFRRISNGAKKERSFLQPIVMRTSKQKKEDSGTSKDRTGKMKARVAEKDADIKKRSALTSKTVFSPINNVKQLELCEDRGSKFLKSDFHNAKSGDLKDTKLPEHVTDGIFPVSNNIEQPKNNLAAVDHCAGAFSSDTPKHTLPVGGGLKEGYVDHQVPAVAESSRTDAVVASFLKNNKIGSLPVNEEDANLAIDYLDEDGGHSSKSDVIDRQKSKPSVECLASAAPEVKDSSVDLPVNSVQPKVKLKTEAVVDNHGGFVNSHSSLSDVKLEEAHHVLQHPVIFSDNLSENTQVNFAVASSLWFSDRKEQDVKKSSQLVVCHIDKSSELSHDACLLRREFESSEGAMAMQKGSSELKHGSKLEESSKSGGGIVIPSQRKMVSSVGKSTSTSSPFVISKSTVSDNCKPANSHNPISVVKQVLSDSNVSIKKDQAAIDLARNENRHEMPRKASKEHPKSSVYPALKASQSSRISYVSKRTLPNSKELVPSSSSKTSTSHDIAVTSGSSESIVPLQTQSALPSENKISAPGLPNKSDRFSQTSSHLSKMNHTSPMHPPVPSSTPATLSDEELALLLHQELNSSPRVPRVPRMRHAGSLPQLASPTATSMLVKRSSGSGGKDQSLVSRRRNKDVAKDGGRSSRDIDDEAKRMDRTASSPDQREQDLVCTAETSTKRDVDDDSSKAVHSVKKNVSTSSTMAANSGPSSSAEANDQIFPSVHDSSRNISDDDTGTNETPAHQTLPGLINEIMSKGRRMTYEELCNAVLPHWHNLRKHNGERYAYSSHSQAVLDCLRNRNEWAQLVDRGPKTNSSRKRRKPDAELQSYELDNEYGKIRAAKEAEGKNLESHQEEFPKGKRKARKRRRLALQGRGIKDVRKRRADTPTDDDIGVFPNSSEESTFSEDEIQEGRTCPVGSEASASSDDTGTML